eukprot:snap_masked-scaffold_11-processed-gene-11.25-mRNA-1 protein AED:1.00 eAED:1.00 QI:0/0/0/0/1/1/2/0/388
MKVNEERFYKESLVIGILFSVLLLISFFYDTNRSFNNYQVSSSLGLKGKEAEEDYTEEEKFSVHLMMYYNKLKPRYFCLVENLILRIIENENNKIPVEINVWVKDLNTLEEGIIEQTIQPIQALIQDSIRFITLNFKTLDFDKIIKSTPLEELYKCEPSETVECKPLGKYADQNKANAARLAILFTYGGIYMDLDFVVFEDPSVFKSPFLLDGVSKQSSKKFNNALFKLTKGNKKILIWMMKFFVSNYDGNKWGNNGPQMFTKFFSGQSNDCSHNKTHINCSDNLVLKIWPTEIVYPIFFWGDDAKLFKAPLNNLMEVLDDRTAITGKYFIHLWHKLTFLNEKQVCKNKDEAERIAAYLNISIGALKAESCPHVFEIMKKTALPACDF